MAHVHATAVHRRYASAQKNGDATFTMDPGPQAAHQPPNQGVVMKGFVQDIEGMVVKNDKFR